MASENAIIERAEMYLRKLSCGINPLTDEILPEGDSCKQERISKCLAYVASLLQQQLNHDQVAPIVTEKAPRPAKRAPKPQMQELSIDAESLKRYRFFDYPVSISRVVRNINELLPDNMNHLLYADVANFLVQEGILSRQVAEDGTTSTRNAGSRRSSTSWTTFRNASPSLTSASRTARPTRTNGKKDPPARPSRNST